MYRHINISICLVMMMAFNISLLSPAHSFQQDSFFHQKPLSGIVGEDIELILTMLVDESVVNASIFFRERWETNYEEIHMEIQGRNWKGILPGRLLSSKGLEYVIVLTTNNGGFLATPVETPFETPHFVLIHPGEESPVNFEIRDNGQFMSADILILSPESDELILSEELVIALSFFNAPNIDTTSIQLRIDGEDYTSQTDVSDGIIIFSPNMMKPGFHRIQVRMKTKQGLNIEPIEWNFKVARSGINLQSEIDFNGDLSARQSSEYVGGYSKNVSELNGKMNIGLPWIKSKNTFRITSRESEFQQPQNRFSGNIKLGDYLHVYFGDFNPRLSSFLIDGKRVRGLGIDFYLPWFRFQLVQGELNRSVNWAGKVDGGYRLLSTESFKDSTGRIIYFMDRTGYTFRQNIYAFRLSFDFKSKFLFGIHFLKARDKTGSVDKIFSNQAIFTTNETIFTLSDSSIQEDEYTFPQFLEAITAGDSISFSDNNWGGKDPVDNLVFGFDIGSTFDNRNLKFNFSWNMSLYNRNIWDGAMTLAEMDTTLDDTLDGLIMGEIATSSIPFDPSSVKDYIIMNPYMTPLLPFDYVSFKDHPIATVINMPSAAFSLRLKGNYSWNSFHIEYRQIGPEYTSLGNPYLTKNVREFFIQDRLALLDHKLFLSTSFKHQDNKILASINDPLSTNTFSSSVNLMPGPGVPSLMVNVQSVNKNNYQGMKALDDTIKTDTREDSRMVNTVMSINFPFEIKGYKQNLIINFNTVNNSDELSNKRSSGYLFMKANTKGYSVNLSTQLSLALRTLFTVTRTALILPTDSGDQTSSWTGLGLTANYSMLNNTLNLRGGISYFDVGTSRLYGGKLGGNYKILEQFNMGVSGNLQLSQNLDSDDVWSWGTSSLILTAGYRF